MLCLYICTEFNNFIAFAINLMVRKMYHTQESRGTLLNNPIICNRPDAWLGTGYYFWYDISDAHIWGNKAKKNTGSYDIYEGVIDSENILDTVFDENVYIWWIGLLEQADKEIRKKHSSNKKPTLKQINDYFKKSPGWEDVHGVLFQDLPDSYDYSVIEPIPTKQGGRVFAYKKRIQLALYKKSCLKEFKHSVTQRCK